MQKSNRRFEKVITVLIALSVFVIGIRIGLSQTGNALKSVVEPGSMTSEASYIVFTDGTDYYARNGTTGEIEFSGTNASQIIQSAINALPSGVGGLIAIKEGKYTIDSTITIYQKQNVYIEGVGMGARTTGTQFYTASLSNNQSFIMFQANTSSITGGGVSGINFYNSNLSNSVTAITLSATGDYSIEDTVFENIYTNYCNQGITLDGFCWYNTFRNIYVTSYNTGFVGYWVIGLVKSNTVTQTVYLAPKLNTFENIISTSLDGNWAYFVLLDHSRCNYNVFNNLMVLGANFTRGLFWCKGTSNTLNTLLAMDDTNSSSFKGSIVFESANSSDVIFDQPTIGGFANKVTEAEVSLAPHVAYVNYSFSNEVELKPMMDTSANIVVDGSEAGSYNKIIISNALHVYDNPGVPKAITITSTGAAKSNITWAGEGIENSGTWAGSSPVYVLHGLAGMPTVVIISVNGTQPYSTSWTANSTHITIYHNATGSLSGSWEAKYNP